MNLATLTSATPSAMYSPLQDRAMGKDARETLRESIESAIAPSIDRGYDIYVQVSNALTKAAEKDGTFTSPVIFGRTLELLNLLPREIPLPQVVVESENEIGLDWDEGARQVVSLTVRDTPMVGFAALFGTEPLHGRVVFADEIPKTLRFLLARLFPRQDRGWSRSDF